MDQVLTWIIQKGDAFVGLHPHVGLMIALLAAKSVFFCLMLGLAWLGTKIFIPREDQAPVFPISWSMSSVAQVFFIYVFFQAAAVYFKDPSAAGEQLPGLMALWAAIENLFLFALLWLYLRFGLWSNLRDVGWCRLQGSRDISVLIRGIFFIIVLAVLTNFLYWTEILERSDKVIARVRFQDILGSGGLAWTQLALVLLIAPVCEETFYRGFMYPVLRNRLPGAFSAVLLSLFFASGHFQWSYFVPVFLMSVACTVAYEKTRCVWVSVAIHAFYNFLVTFGVFSY